MSSAIQLSLIIPCYNEEENIPLIVNRLSEVIGERTDIEVILINNGSTDNSLAILESRTSCSSKSFFRIVHVPTNKGYGYGIIQGLLEAKGRLLSWTHADMQTDPNDVLQGYGIYNESKQENIIIKGKRRNRRTLDRFFTWAMQIVTFFYVGTYLDDINAQPKLFSRSFFNTYIKDNAPDDFSLDLYLLLQAKRNNFKILAFPVYFADRVHGEAKGGGSWRGKITLIKRTFAYIKNL